MTKLLFCGEYFVSFLCYCVFVLFFVMIKIVFFLLVLGFIFPQQYSRSCSWRSLSGATIARPHAQSDSVGSSVTARRRITNRSDARQWKNHWRSFGRAGHHSVLSGTHPVGPVCTKKMIKFYRLQKKKLIAEIKHYTRSILHTTEPPLSTSQSLHNRKHYKLPQ